MKMRDFTSWLETMRPSINGYGYYVDFPKVYQNVDKIKIPLHILNSLIGSKTVKEDCAKIFDEYPETLKCIPILLAVREREIYAQDEDGAFHYNFAKPNLSKEKYLTFMEKTGLFDLISKHIVNNLVDYVLGIETGLDSNGRKNRGGHQMEDLVERYIKETGVEYYKEMYLSEMERKWGVDLSSISAQGTADKRWDFVAKTPAELFVIETNFYTGGGSKLNEVSRSYKMIAEEAANIPNFHFVWITDGYKGWKSARRNLEETFDILPTLFNISDLEQGELIELFSGRY